MGPFRRIGNVSSTIIGDKLLLVQENYLKKYNGITTAVQLEKDTIYELQLRGRVISDTNIKVFFSRKVTVIKRTSLKASNTSTKSIVKFKVEYSGAYKIIISFHNNGDKSCKNKKAYLESICLEKIKKDSPTQSTEENNLLDIDVSQNPLLIVKEPEQVKMASIDYYLEVNLNTNGVPEKCHLPLYKIEKI
jgi:hypothetical protein